MQSSRRKEQCEFRNKTGAGTVTGNSIVWLQGKGRIGKEWEKDLENTAGNIPLESPYFQAHKCVLNFSKSRTDPTINP